MQKVDKRIENHNATTYKTRHYSDQQITHLNESANAQEKQIGRIFYRSPDKSFGPTHIHKLLFPNFPASPGDHPITSTRRAINNLTETGILQKTDSTTRSLLDGESTNGDGDRHSTANPKQQKRSPRLIRSYFKSTPINKWTFTDYGGIKYECTGSR